MGASTSKGARTAAGATTRRYPSRVPPISSNPATQPKAAPQAASQNVLGPTARSQAQPRTTRDEAINIDGADPQYAASLRSLGPVQPNPFHSNSSTFESNARPGDDNRFPDPRKNLAIRILQARDRLAAEAEKEFIESGRSGHAGREFLDIFTIRQILMLRDDKRLPADEIERKLDLKTGVVQRLGQKGVVGLAGHLGG